MTDLSIAAADIAEDPYDHEWEAREAIEGVLDRYGFKIDSYQLADKAGKRTLTVTVEGLKGDPVDRPDFLRDLVPTLAQKNYQFDLGVKITVKGTRDLFAQPQLPLSEGAQDASEQVQ